MSIDLCPGLEWDYWSTLYKGDFGPHFVEWCAQKEREGWEFRYGKVTGERSADVGFRRKREAATKVSP